MIYILSKCINENRNINVYGAGKRAIRILDLLQRCGLQRLIRCFIVQDVSGNPADIEGIPVVGIQDECVDRTDAFNVISLADKTIAAEVKAELLRTGYRNVVYYSAELNELPEYIAAKEYLESLDGSITVSKKEFDEFGFCHISIDDSWLWRFSHTRLSVPVRVKEEFFPKERLLDAYEASYGEYLPLSSAFAGIIKNPDGLKCTVKIFRALGAFDKAPLRLQAPTFTIPIQVGAALTEERICDITDDTGDNISYLNRDFSECTALYWIWKNEKEADYVGLFHYARFIDVTEEDMTCLDKGGVDIVLTTPMIVGSPIRDFFCPRYFPRKDWKLMEEMLLKHYPEYEKTLEEYNRAFCYPGANLSIMRKEIFDEYAEFAFTVTMDVIEYYKSIGVVRQDRYAGYLMENLMAMFAMHNRDKYKIAMTDFMFVKEYI